MTIAPKFAPTMMLAAVLSHTAWRLANTRPALDAISIKPYTGNSTGGRSGGAEGRPMLTAHGRTAVHSRRVVSSPVGVSARKIILEAHHLNALQLSGGPSWLDSERFSMEAKAESAGEEQLRQMLQTQLEERFKLAAHRAKREVPVYVLMAVKNGSKLHEGDHENSFRDMGTLQHLAEVLSGQRVGRLVLDRTGRLGSYLFSVEWDSNEGFVPAVQEQLGLRLESQRSPVEFLIIERIEAPKLN
jgi:uncharacterized protein (TIGR03435 family)